MSKINFHQTFPPTLEYLSRLLEITNMAEEITKEDISKKTGIPTGEISGKVEPHIDYAIFMGLIVNISETKGKYKLICTSLGNIIKSEDIGLREEITQLVCHSRLTSLATGAPLWRYITRYIMPKYPRGIKTILLEDELRKTPDFATGKIKIGAFYSTYIKSFEAFSLLTKEKDILRVVPQLYKNELLYVYAYSLLYEWEQIYKNTNEISSEQLEKLKVTGVFGFNDAMLYQILELLSEKSIIKINGQLSPFTIIKISSSEVVQNSLYSLLY